MEDYIKNSQQKVAQKQSLNSILADLEKNLPSIELELSDVSSDEGDIIPIFHKSLQLPVIDLINNADDDQNIGIIDEEEKYDLEKEDFSSFKPAICSSHKDNLAFKTHFESLDNKTFLMTDLINSRNKVQHLLLTSEKTSFDDNKFSFFFEDKAAYDSNDNRNINVNVSDGTIHQSSPNNLKTTDISDSELGSRTELVMPQNRLCAVKKSIKQHDDCAREKLESKKVNSCATSFSEFFEEAPPKLNTNSLNLNVLTSLLAEVKQGDGTSLPDGQQHIKMIQANDISDDKENLLDRLTRHCLEQTKVSPLPFQFTSSNLGKDQTTTDKSVIKQTTSTGCTTNGWLSPAKDNAVSKETIFIDLRNSAYTQTKEQSDLEAIKQMLGKNDRHCSSDSDDDDDDGGELWHEQRRKMKISIENARKQATSVEKLDTSIEKQADSFKKSKLSDVQKETWLSYKFKTGGNLSASENSGTSKNLIKSERAEKIINTPDPKTLQGSLTAKEDVHQENISNKTDNTKQLEESRKNREQLELQRQSRERIRQQLESLQTGKSVSGKSAAASVTSVLFDIEASYEPAPCVLPSNWSASETELVLLTIHLSPDGGLCCYGQKKRDDMEEYGISATLCTLLSWLLSLTPNSMEKVSNEAQYPFFVIGLQRLFIDGQLSIFVAVKPADMSFINSLSAKSKRGKRKEDTKMATPFQTFLTRFFSANTLQMVCPCTEALTSNDIFSSTLDLQTSQFVYRPSLPVISTKYLSSYIHVSQDKDSVNKVFGLQPGFFWETIDCVESLADVSIVEEDEKSDDILNAQVTVCLLHQHLYANQESMLGVLSRALQLGLDVCGMRLLYPVSELISPAGGLTTSVAKINCDSSQRSADLKQVDPIVALALRGASAHTVWLEAVGPCDPVLARRTDINSLSAMYGGGVRTDTWIFVPRNALRIHQELVRWFGGRVPSNGVINVKGRPVHSGKANSSDLLITDKTNVGTTSLPVVTLSATTRNDILLAVSPLVPVSSLAHILFVCQSRDFHLKGIRRMHFGLKQLTALGIPSNLSQYFVPQPANNKDIYYPRPGILLLLSNENGWSHSASLIEAIMVHLNQRNILSYIQSFITMPLLSRMLFHVLPYKKSAIISCGGELHKTPNVVVSPKHVPNVYLKTDEEHIVTLIMTGWEVLRTASKFMLNQLNLAVASPLHNSSIKPKFELIGIKWLPCLDMSQAKEITPYEIGDKQWKPSLNILTTEPLLVLVLRGIDAFNNILPLLPTPKPGISTVVSKYIVSMTAELAYQTIQLFFTENELFSDDLVRSMLKYIPPSMEVSVPINDGAEKPSSIENVKKENIMRGFLSSTQLLNTILVIKPEFALRQFTKVLKRLVGDDFTITGIYYSVLTVKQALRLIPEEHQNKEQLLQKHLDYLTHAEPSMILSLQRQNAIKRLLNLIDGKEWSEHRYSTLKSIFGPEVITNGFYGSPSYNDACMDLDIFFSIANCSADKSAVFYEMPSHCQVGSETREVVFAKFANSIISTHREGELQLGSLTQTNCVVFLPPLLAEQQKNKTTDYAEIIELLLRSGFSMVGCKMLELNKNMASDLITLCNKPSSASLREILLSGPLLVMAVQRDNAVIAFDSILECSQKGEQLFKKCKDWILRCNDNAQAAKILAFFFDKLYGVHASVVPRLM